MRLTLSLVLLHVNAAPLAMDDFASTIGQPPSLGLPAGWRQHDVGTLSSAGSTDLINDLKAAAARRRATTDTLSITDIVSKLASKFDFDEKEAFMFLEGVASTSSSPAHGQGPQAHPPPMAKEHNCTGLAVETGPLRRPFRLWIHGEPGLVSAKRAAIHDVVLCIEIARERTARPQNTFWMPLYNFPPKRAPANATALSKRPVDMLYQSSNCDSRREQFAGTVRRIFEAEGLRFEHSGKCSAGSSRPRYQVPAAAPGDADPESLTTKLMMSISRSQNPRHEALDEKLALPMLRGAALPLYMGTGHRIAQEEGYPMHAILDRAEFKSDDEVAKAAAKLAKDPAELDKRQKEVLAYEWKFGSTSGRHYVACRNFSFATKQVQVKVSTDHKQPVFLEQLHFLFGGRYDFVYGARGDVIIDQCCWGNKVPAGVVLRYEHGG